MSVEHQKSIEQRKEERIRAIPNDTTGFIPGNEPLSQMYGHRMENMEVTMPAPTVKQREIGTKNAEATKAVSVEKRKTGMGNAKATNAMTYAPQRNMAPKNAVVRNMEELVTKIEYIPDQVESASEIKGQKHTSAYKKKRDKRKKKRLEAAADELRQVARTGRLLRKQERRIEDYDKAQAMDEELRQKKIADLDSEFRSVLDQQYLRVWEGELAEEEKEAIIAYTADYKTAGNTPHGFTMNHILRRGEYRIDGGEDVQLQYRKDINAAVEESDMDYDLIESSKQNYLAVTNCINALKKSKLPQDMVFRRGTSVKTLACMLGMNPWMEDEELAESIDKKLIKYNEGNDIIFDRGFFSASAFSDAGPADQVEWVIQGHAGDEALFLGNQSWFPEEGEMLFQAGTRFRILRMCPPGTAKIHKGNPGAWKVYLETIPRLEPLRGENV